MQLVALAGVSGGFFAAFVWLVPIRSVRELVDDVREHLTPVVTKVLRMGGPTSALDPGID